MPETIDDRTWLVRCSSALMERVPGLDPTGAGEFALLLFRAWRKLTPDTAVACFLTPQLDVVAWGARELA